MSDKKSWKNEAISFEIQDIVRYNDGYLCVLRYSAKGTTWYTPLPAERTLVDALLKGQKLLAKIK